MPIPSILRMIYTYVLALDFDIMGHEYHNILLFNEELQLSYLLDLGKNLNSTKPLRLHKW